MGVNFSDLIFIIAWIAERENCERNRKKKALFMRIDDKKNAPAGKAGAEYKDYKVL